MAFLSAVAHSIAAYQRFQKWRADEKEKCVVTLNWPKMKIKGFVYEKGLFTDYVAFLGVPYARPPVGTFRFDPPEPYTPQQGPRRIYTLGLATKMKLKAYKEAEPCLQTFGDDIRGSEDCLYLNIYTPGKPTLISELLPVLVYFHGGGFDHSSGNQSFGISPRLILKENMVFVTVNYRLGILGFLNMRSENCRGNAGLKDQVMALRWIKKNIRKFNGNPNNVTIAGHSAGGSCVNFHMISPLSKGLFHKAIVMGGGVYCPWGFGGNAKVEKLLFMKALGKETEMVHVVVEALKEKASEELLQLYQYVAGMKFALEPKRMKVFLKPTREYTPKDAFLPNSIKNLMKRAKPVPTIAGITEQEGYMFFRGEPEEDKVALVRETTQFRAFVKHNFRWNNARMSSHFQKVKDMYFPDVNTMTDDEIKERLATMVTDIYFRRFYDNFRIGELMQKRAPPLYVYEFGYFTGKPLVPFPRTESIESTASEHGDDMSFILRPDVLDNRLERFPEEQITELENDITNVMNHMLSLYSSFCRKGVPKSTVQQDLHWKPHTEKDPHYLHIAPSLTMRNRRLNEERWNQINEICRRDPEV